MFPFTYLYSYTIPCSEWGIRGGILGSIVGVALILFIVSWCKIRKKRKEARRNELHTTRAAAIARAMPVIPPSRRLGVAGAHIAAPPYSLSGGDEPPAYPYTAPPTYSRATGYLPAGYKATWGLPATRPYSYPQNHGQQ